jgi:muramidase (phage lysozyme)
MVHMPEAAIYENHRAEPRQHDVGRAGQVAAVQAETEAKAMQDSPDNQLWFGIPTTDASHHPTACHGIHDVGHQLTLDR